MIQAIVYDAVGTLIHPRPSVAALYADIGRRFGSQVDETCIRQRFAAVFADQDRIDAASNWHTSEARERARWQHIVAHVLDDVADPAGCFDALFDAFGQLAAWSYDADAVEVLTQLRRAGFRQAMASNFDGRLHRVIAGMPIGPFLAPIIVSSEVGYRKPAPEFFTEVAERLQLAPASILFVGDDRTNDYEPARRAGMQALLLDSDRCCLDVGLSRIEKLRDLLDLPLGD